MFVVLRGYSVQNLAWSLKLGTESGNDISWVIVMEGIKETGLIRPLGSLILHVSDVYLGP